MILAMILAFGIWYVIFWFISTEPNPLLWDGLFKFIYLILGLILWNKLENDFSGLINEKEIEKDEI